MPFLVALGLGLVLTPLLALVGRRVGLVDHPSGDGLKIHAEPRPLTGGIAVVTATVAATLLVGDGLEPLVVVGVALLLAVGVADDAASLPQLVRLVAQLGAGVAMAAGGLTFEPLGPLGPVVVAIAVPAMANAVNMIDGQDGLAAGLAADATLGITLILGATGDLGSLGPALLASLLAFLLWNRPPARVFLGDGGAYAVGGILVVLAADAAVSWETLIAVAICLLIFEIELCSSVIRRAVRRESVIGGDRTHAYDLLAARLSSRTRATAVLLASGLLLAAIGRLAAVLPVGASASLLALTAVGGGIGVLALGRSGRAGVRRTR
jgi:UDP-GlcNAc:undecaprenyl-phosphate GlcNAc-1-phosphate transferase